MIECATNLTAVVRAASTTGEGEIVPPKSTIFITGGATGIGLGYAKRWVAAGHTVVACSRRQTALDAGRAEVPQLKTFLCDVETAESRRALFNHVQAEYPEVNVLVNNAAVALTDMPDLSKAWELREREFDINVLGPMHLQLMFAEKFLQTPQRKAVIINVSTGAALVPVLDISSYSASKAALHSFTLSHRVALRGTNVRVVEIFPGPVLTDILPPQYAHAGMSIDAHADRVFEELAMGVQEISDSHSEQLLRLSRDESDAQFAHFCGVDSIF